MNSHSNFLNKIDNSLSYQVSNLSLRLIIIQTWSICIMSTSTQVLAICGSLRAKSSNKGLLRYAQANAPEGMSIVIADLSDIPFYNADITE
ncbi:MAG: NAD(P)H-dependent oxidoreductase, partial [Deefgea sp.]